MDTSFALLGLLHRHPSYGYDLKKDYDALFGRHKPLPFGQVYATLARLLRDKKIFNEALEQDAGPERKRYALTAKGRAAVVEWLSRSEQSKTVQSLQSTLFIKVATAILTENSPADFLDAQRAAHLQRMRELTVLRREGDLAQMLQADYALFHLEADLRWMDVTAARIETLSQEMRHV